MSRIIRTRFSDMRNRVTFLEEISSGPEAGEGDLEEVFSCACAVEEISFKDFEILNLSAEKKYITIITRNNRSAFQPDTFHKLKLRDGLAKDKTYNVKELFALPNTKEQYLKIVGEQSE